MTAFRWSRVNRSRPRDAAVAVVRLVNSRNQHVSMLALFLLDILVKNCSFPFHLQVATKEFLNELVRRFPERPPPLAPPPMAKILELIHEWKNTICVTSKFKEDLSHIRDMHRLLTYKGSSSSSLTARHVIIRLTKTYFGGCRISLSRLRSQGSGSLESRRCWSHHSLAR